MTVLPLQPGILYGPVRSRRLGRSLGINLLPGGCKVCSFDCVYCHYGRTGVKTTAPEERELPAVDQVLRAVREAVRARRDLDYLTFSGNGEPTLHPRFPEIVAGVRRIRDEEGSSARLAILSNSSTAHLPAVREALGLLDVPIMKLDAGDPRTLARVNRPAAGVGLPRILEGLRRVPGLVVQSVMLRGKASNVEAPAFEAWLAAIADLRPGRVQLYSTDRPVAEAGVERVPPADLQRMAAQVTQRTGVPAQAYWVTD